MALRLNDRLGGDLRPPEFERHMLSGVHEVVVRREQGQFVPSAKLDEKGIDRSDLHTSSTARVAYFGSRDVIVSIGGNDW